MDKKAIIIISIMIALVLISCSKDPKELFSSYVDKYKGLSEYKIIYKIDNNIVVEKQYPPPSEMKSGTFKKGNNQKDVTEMDVFGQSVMVSFYDLGGRIIACGESGDDTECVEGDDLSIVFYPRLSGVLPFTKINPDDPTLTYEGSGEFIGRKCDKFKIKNKDLAEFFFPWLIYLSQAEMKSLPILWYV